MSQLRDRQAEGERIPLTQRFCSIRDLSGLDGAHPHWGGQFAFQTFSSSRNIFTDTPRMFNQMTVKLTYKINHHIPSTQDHLTQSRSSVHI